MKDTIVLQVPSLPPQPLKLKEEVCAYQDSTVHKDLLTQCLAVEAISVMVQVWLPLLDYVLLGITAVNNLVYPHQ